MAVLDVAVLLISAAACCFGVVGRFYWAWQIGASTDTWYHLLLSDTVRETWSLPERVDQFIFDAPYDYPPALHVLLALFPSDLVYRFRWAFSPIIELAHLLLVGGVTYLLIGEPVTPLVAMAIYATTPALLRHFTTLTPRVLGSFLFSLTVLSLLFAVQRGSVWHFAAPVLFGTALLLTHRMSTQTLAFFCLFLAIWFANPVYAAVLVPAFLLAVALSGGQYLRVLEGHLSIINFWRKQHRKGQPPGEFMRQYGQHGTMESANASLWTRLVAVAKRYRHTVLFIGGQVWLFLLAALILAGYGYATLGPFQRALTIWALFILGLAVLTQFVPKFKLIGEGHKYYMWGGLPTAVTLASILRSVDSPLLYAVFGLGSIALMAYITLRMRFIVANAQKVNFSVGGDDEVVEYIKAVEGRNVMCLPHNLSYATMYFADADVLYSQNPGGDEKVKAFFPVPTEPLYDLAETHDIDFVLLDKRRLELDKLDIDPFATALETDGYLLLEQRRSG